MDMLIHPLCLTDKCNKHVNTRISQVKCNHFYKKNPTEFLSLHCIYNHINIISILIPHIFIQKNNNVNDQQTI